MGIFLVYFGADKPGVFNLEVFKAYRHKALILAEHFTLTFLYVNFSKGINTLEIFSIVEFHYF